MSKKDPYESGRETARRWSRGDIPWQENPFDEETEDYGNWQRGFENYLGIPSRQTFPKYPK